jgi:hypothetical protein
MEQLRFQESSYSSGQNSWLPCGTTLDRRGIGKSGDTIGIAVHIERQESDLPKNPCG